MRLHGCFTALVTPFAKGQVDFARLRELVEFQLANGVAGLVPVGTTGESPTLDFDEHKAVIETVVQAVHGRVPVIAGTGANSTAEALELTRFAKTVGADATLQVTPYYNKPTQEGLYRHFATIADTVGLPVVLYNVPGRCGVAIEIDTVARLASHGMIVAIKEAAGLVDRVSQIRSVCALPVLSGDDGLTYPMMALGATGVISVAGNVVPREMSELTRLALAGDYVAACALHYRLYPLFKALFIETNPIPVKAAVALLGRAEEEYRLPLCPLAPANKAKLVAAMTAFGLLKK